MTAGIDWFDIGGLVDFGGVAAPLPDLLAAVRRGESMVVLPDNSMGVLTDEWLAQYGGLSAFAGPGPGEGRLRARASQLGLVDALLSSREGVTWADRALEVRDRLRGFEGISAADAPPSFAGTLRGYQRLGLGWLRFLQDLSIGGCLADDMGLGKTVTVLALLDERRLAKQGAPRGPPRHSRARRRVARGVPCLPRRLARGHSAPRAAPAARCAAPVVMTTGFMLDTDTVSWALRGQGAVAEHLLAHRPSEICISSITLAELRFGADAKASRALHRLIDAFVQPIDVLPFDEQAAGRFGSVAAALARRGEPIGTYDTLIAAQALAWGLTLVTNNTKHFQRVAGLKLANWV